MFRDSSTAALADAAARGDKARVLALVRNGADPNAHGDKGVTLLQWALLNRSVPGLEALMAAGADPAGADSQFRTLLAAGAKPNLADRRGDTPLHAAAKINAYAGRDAIYAWLEAHEQGTNR